MLKKIVSVILVITLVLGMVPAALAAESVTAEEQSQQITRAEVCYALWSLDGHPFPDGQPSFNDVGADHPFYTAISYAVSKGYAAGIGENTFDPDGKLTRAQAAMLLWRMKGQPAADPSGFEDVVAEAWYYPAVNWLTIVVANAGTSETEFSPMDSCTKEDFMLFLYGAVTGLADGIDKSSAWSWAESKGLIYREGMQTGALFAQGANIRNGEVVDYSTLYSGAFCYPYGHIVRFCLGNESSFTPLEVQSVSASNPDVLMIGTANRYPGHWVFTCSRVGTTDVTVETTDGQSYTMTIEVRLTENGFFTSTWHDESTVIAGEYDFRTLGNTFYCLEAGGWAFIPDNTTVTVDGNPDYVTVSLVKVGEIEMNDGSTENRNAIKIELDVDNTPDGSFICVNYQVKCRDGSTEFRGMGITLGFQNGPSEPQNHWFSFQLMHPDGNGSYVPEIARYTGFGGRIGEDRVIHPLLPDGTEVSVQSSDPNVVQVLGGPGSYQTLRFVGQGYATLTYTDNSGNTYYGDAFCETNSLKAYPVEYQDGHYTANVDNELNWIELESGQEFLVSLETWDGDPVGQIISCNPNVVKLEKVEGTDYWKLTYVAPGKTTILADNAHVLDVSCLPMEFLQIESMIEDGSGNYVPEPANFNGIGRMPNESEIIYPLLDGVNDGSITLSSADTNVATVERVAGTDYWKVSFINPGETVLTYTVNDQVYTLNVRCHNGPSGPVEEPGLFLQWVDLDWETGKVFDSGKIWDDDFRIGNGWLATFCNGTSNSYTPLNVKSVTSSNSDVVSVSQNDEFSKYWDVSVNGLGNATITVVTDDGTYTMNVEGQLPNHAFTTAPKIEAATLLPRDYDLSEGNVFYLVVDDEWSYIPAGAAVEVRADGRAADYVQWELVPMEGDTSRYAIKITIDKEQAPNDFRLEIQHDVLNNGSTQPYRWSRDIHILNPGLFLTGYFVDQTNEVVPWGTVRRITAMSDYLVKLCDGYPDDYQELDIVSVVSSDPNVAEMVPDPDFTGGYWRLECKGAGIVNLTMTDADGQVYTLNLTVEMPAFAFSNAFVMTPNNLIGKNYDFTADGRNVFYLTTFYEDQFIPKGSQITLHGDSDIADYISYRLVPTGVMHQMDDDTQVEGYAIEFTVDVEKAPPCFWLEVEFECTDQSGGKWPEFCGIELGVPQPRAYFNVLIPDEEGGYAREIAAFGGIGDDVGKSVIISLCEIDAASEPTILDPSIASIAAGPEPGLYTVTFKAPGYTNLICTDKDGIVHYADVFCKMDSLSTCLADQLGSTEAVWGDWIEGDVNETKVLYVEANGQPVTDLTSADPAVVSVKKVADTDNWEVTFLQPGRTALISAAHQAVMVANCEIPGLLMNVYEAMPDGSLQPVFSEYDGMEGIIGEELFIEPFVEGSNGAIVLQSSDPTVATVEPVPNTSIWKVTCVGPGETTLFSKDPITGAVCEFAVSSLEYTEHEHIWDSGTVRLPADCTHTGETVYKCTECGFERVEYPDALGHSLTVHEAVEAECEKTGSTAYWSCDVCNKYFADAEGNEEIEKDSWIIPAKGHTLTAHEAVEAECEKTGSAAYWSCDICNKYFSDADGKTEIEKDSWIVPAKGHTLTAHEAVEAECEKTGSAAYWSCDICGKYFSDAEGKTEIERDSWVIPATGHSYTDVITAPTCTARGYTVHTCEVCGDTYADTFVEPTGHSYTDVVTAPTCTARGYTTHTCDRCGSSYVDTLVNALGHLWNEGEVTVEPTADGAGVKTFTCQREGCGVTRTEVMPELGHTFTSEVTAPTCTTRGYTTYTCETCEDHSYVADYVDAMGHSYRDTVTAPTCTDRGYTTHVCERCSHKLINCFVDALGHSYAVSEVVPATADQAGYTTYTCGICGDSYQVEIPMLGHEFTAEVTAPTCTEQGYTTYTCSTCAAEGKTHTYMDNYIPAKGHAWEAGISVEADCSHGGYTPYECSVCHEKKIANQTAMTGHTFENGECTSCGTKDLSMGSELTLHVQALTEMPDTGELKAAFKNVDTMKAEMEEQTRLANDGAEYDNTQIYSVELKSGSSTASANNFPEDGFEVVIPYPAGTNKKFTFSLTHMFAETYGGNVAGEMEHLNFWLEEDGIHFVVHSLSPILLAWSEPTPDPIITPPVPTSTSYDITAVESANGKLSISTDSAAKGDTVTVTATPDKSYVLNTLTVKDANGKEVALTQTGENTYTFKMPGSKVTVDAAFKWAECAKDDACTLVEFSDLNGDAWYHDTVEYCIEKGIMNGVGEGQFDPEGSATRAMIVTMIARMAGADDPNGETWYSNAVAWAMKMDITDGINMESKITREQVVAMLYRYSKLSGMDVSASAELNSFKDAAEVSDWATESMQWAVAIGLIEGSDNKLYARDNATRAEIATMFFRYCEIIAK